MTREERVQALIDEHGKAYACEFDPPYKRWALMEANMGAGARENGGPWWTCADDWKDLLGASACQEYPEDWPAETLFDLDTDFETAVEQDLAYRPEVDPPGPSDKVELERSS